MKCIIDIESNSLTKPTKIWLVVCKDIETNKVHIFRNLTTDEYSRNNFLNFAKGVTLWIGHNLLDYDLPILNRLIDYKPDLRAVIDTLILSRLVDYSRPAGHSIRAYGEEFGLEKISFNDWTKWSQEMEEYCVRDVEINHRVYNLYSNHCSDILWNSAIRLEHDFQLIVNDLHDNGFAFNTIKANKLLEKVTKELDELDTKIRGAFPPREVLIREFSPRATKYGTISKTSIPRIYWDRIHEYELGKLYRHTRLEDFNPSSHKQLIEVLNNAGWKPEDRTQSHIDTQRQVDRYRTGRSKTTNVARSSRTNDQNSNVLDSDDSRDYNSLCTKLEALKIKGWKVNELNLSTLPKEAPEPARFLAKRILLEARRRSLVEWLGLVQDDNRIHGKFVGIGAWTHRMAHQRPNTANIPTAVQMDGSTKLLGKELRELWCAPKGKVLVGVDAEGIQLRIFAHYINDPEFTDALVRGRKDGKSDPHSLNQRILGRVCKTRQAAKRFIFALLLGAGVGKLSSILECPVSDTQQALEALLRRYQGFQTLKDKSIPADAKRGYFIGLDGRKVKIPGDTERDKQHLCMSGYLQNGEAIVIKRAALLACEKIRETEGLSSWKYVDIVHDELQSECENKMSIAEQVAKIKADAIREAGEYYKLRCPMQGSYWNDDSKRATIGTNWYQTH